MASTKKSTAAAPTKAKSGGSNAPAAKASTKGKATAAAKPTTAARSKRK